MENNYLTMIIKPVPALKDKVNVFDDLRKVKPFSKKKYGNHYHIHKVPPLPEFTDRTYRYKDIEMNLYQLTCSCESFNDKLLLGYEERDVRRLCIHLYYKLINSAAKNSIGQLTKILMEAAVKHNALHFYKYYFRKENKEVYFSFSDHTDWINVFIQVRPEEDADYIRLGYNPSQHRWNYGKAPELANRIEYVVDKLKISAITN